MLEILFAGGVSAYLAGAVAGLAGWRSPRAARIGAFGFALAGALLETIAAVIALTSGNVFAWEISAGLAPFAWTVRITPLSAFFSLALGVIAAAVSIYSLGYVKRMGPRRNAGALGFFCNILFLRREEASRR
jgi:hydrogenase-4 component B